MTTDLRSLPNEAWAVALAALPGCGQHHLRTVLEVAGHDAERAWRLVAGGDRAAELAAALGRGGVSLVATWRAAAPAVDVGRTWTELAADSIGVWVERGAGYPAALVDDPDPPPILYWRGDPSALGRAAVAIVGTRRCTAYGADVARSLGRDLAAAGVAVVSGLALGIDGAAHEGALAARRSEGERAGVGAGPPIAVVGSGLDVVYPPRHRGLWRRVADHGLVITEAPPGSAPEAWRFPRRNRILAALADVVVVVESHASGGSLSTVRNAIDRGVTVMAVPGSVRSPASAGTNRLLADGAAPVMGVDDVLTALSLEGVTLGPAATSPTAAQEESQAEESPVLAAVDWTPTATEDILRRTGLTLGAAATELSRLEVEGRVRRRGAWWERR